MGHQISSANQLSLAIFMNERHATLAHRVFAMHAGHSPPLVRHRRDAALFPNYFGQTC